MTENKRPWDTCDDANHAFASRESLGIDEPTDPAYNAFRRHLEEHMQAESRSLLEGPTAADPAVSSGEVPAEKPETDAAIMAFMTPAKAQRLARENARSPGKKRPLLKRNSSYLLVLGLGSAALGFLLSNALQHAQNPLKKSAASGSKARPSSEAISHADRAALRKNPAASPRAATPGTAEVPIASPGGTNTLQVLSSETALSKGLTTRAVEVRRGPGQNFEIIDSLPPGLQLEGSLTTDRRWLRVRPGAFVSLEALQLRDASAEDYQAFWVGKHPANIREFPLRDAKVLRKVEPGAELQLQAFNAEWAQVADGGFVFRKLVSSEVPRRLRLPASMRVTVEKAEIHGGPGQQYPVIGLYFRNHKVEVQDVKNGWLQVGPEQFIRAQELELSVKANKGKAL